MAYSTEANAGFRLTTTSGLATVLGKIAALIEKVVDREPIQADGNNFPVSRPVDAIDARVTVESLDQSMATSETAAAANLTVNYSQAGGGTASVIVGALLASGVQHTMRRRMGGFAAQQTYELQGTLTYTPTA